MSMPTGVISTVMLEIQRLQSVHRAVKRMGCLTHSMIHPINLLLDPVLAAAYHRFVHPSACDRPVMMMTSRWLLSTLSL